MPDRRLGVQLHLLREREGEEGGGGLEDGCAQLLAHAVACDLEEACCETGVAHGVDDGLAGGRGRVQEVGPDVDGRDGEVGRAARGHGGEVAALLGGGGASGGAGCVAVEDGGSCWGLGKAGEVARGALDEEVSERAAGDE